MNQVDERVDSIEHLDFKPTCTLRVNEELPRCGREAVWASAFKCCGGVFFQCDDHKDGVGDRGLECRCGTHWDTWPAAVSNRWRI